MSWSLAELHALPVSYYDALFEMLEEDQAERKR